MARNARYPATPRACPCREGSGRWHPSRSRTGCHESLCARLRWSRRQTSRRGSWRRAHLEAAERLRGALAPPDHFRHAGDSFGAVLVGEVGHQLHRVAVEDHRLVAVIAEIDRHHVGLDAGQGVELEFRCDLRWHGELHRTRDLVTESVDQLDGGRHPAGVGIGFQAHRVQARALQDRRRGQSVVAGTDDDRVVIAHCRRSPCR